MKKYIILIFSLIVLNVSAKKVKFSVDMSNETVSSLGVHVVGDFQVAAGYALDWDPSLTELTQEGSTNIYSIVVNIPAFQKYEFRFVNGDQTYESEFIPDESRVGYNFNDNRWFYLDSLQNDTTNLGAIVFGGNAPAGMSLVRYKVDMSFVTVSSNNVHLAANYNAFSPNKNTMYSFPDNPDLNIYEVIHFVSNGIYNFNFVNGNTSGDKENAVPSSCASSGVRYITVSKDTVFPNICYNYCLSCTSVSVKEIGLNTSFKMFPNPAKNTVNIVSSDNSMIQEINVFDISSKNVLQLKNINQSYYTLTDLGLSSGLYLLVVKNQHNQIQNLKLYIE